jgi:mono/diheme cytochrome c family protein
MNYPFWDVGIAYGVLIAAVAVLHVFVSHFAIGGGLYLVLSERAARKANDAAQLKFLEGLSRLFVMITLVLGALTGVGIWFTIGLLNPAAVEVLIHNFIWVWATEWVFFIVEITASILYYSSWQRLPARDHMIIGWIYFAASWLSLFAINGIITFMLTPGRWLSSGDSWDGFFNPTFWPSLVFRTGVCLMLAGLYALLAASCYQAGDFKRALVRRNALWGITGLAVVGPSFYWYWRAIPADVTNAAALRMPIPVTALHSALWLAGAVALLLIFFGLIIPKRYHVTVAVLGLMLGLAWFGAFEWFRESVRKPYVIFGYMYGNSLEVTKADSYRASGLLAQMSYRSGDDGADLFRRACRSCHTINGYNPLRPRFDGTDPTFIGAVVRAPQRLSKGNMPPFMGSAGEADKIAAHLYARMDQRPLREIYNLRGVGLGRRVYEIRCALCHPIGGSDDKTSQLANLQEKDLNQVLDMSAELGPGMPAFTAREEERKAMIEYLTSLVKGGAK